MEQIVLHFYFYQLILKKYVIMSYRILVKLTKDIATNSPYILFMTKEESDLSPISEIEIRKKLKSLPRGWEYENSSIIKEFTFPSFNAGLDLVNQLAPFCNKIDHHPDICIYYKKIRFSLKRYSIGGKVTERDFVVAKKIEELYEKSEKS
jgi:4a-hydroxytetrahydrobiopterin dehydratase